MMASIGVQRLPSCRATAGGSHGMDECGWRWGKAGVNLVSTSPDGINWTVADPGGLYRGYGVAWNNPYRGMMNIEQPTIVLGDGSYNTMAYSPDGIRWTGNAGGLGKLMFDGSGQSRRVERFLMGCRG